MHREPRWYQVSADFWMFIDPREWIGTMVLLGYYEPHLIYFINQVCQEGDVCLDIGAHQGYIALHLASRVGTAGRVLAIEPLDSNFARLTMNVEIIEIIERHIEPQLLEKISSDSQVERICDRS